MINTRTPLPCHLYLIGFMGTGKSTAAFELSRLLKVSRIEMDQMITDREGMEITEIFSLHGEEYFRDLETDTLRELVKKEPSVISCGGGIVLRRENIDLMRKKGRIILLTAAPKTILSRIGMDNSRPNLKGRMSEEGIRELMKKREEFYQAAAQITIKTDKKTPKEISEEICSRISGFPEKNG